MYRRSDPRFRRTLNEISQTIESANESAQANIFTFSHRYLGPCFSSIASSFQSCTSACCPSHEGRARRHRARSLARPELSFDFYDDWDQDETAGLLAWDNDHMESLLPGQGSYGAGATSTQPARERAMSYGARRDKYGRRKSQPHNDPESDPTLIPSSSYFGFLGKISSKLTGGKALRYKPSAADLQEHPGAARTMPPLAENDEHFSPRKRSGTAGSHGTTDSFSSRGDIFPSEDEDDAVPLDDEFAMVLERRTTGSGLEDASNGGKPRRPGKRPSTGSRMSTRTMSSRSTRTSKRRSRVESASPSREILVEQEPKPIPSMTELRQEEDRIREEEEAAITNKREAAQSLALRRGLSVSEMSPVGPTRTVQVDQSLTRVQSPSKERESMLSPPSLNGAPNAGIPEHNLPSPAEPSEHKKEEDNDTIPFPNFETPPTPAEEASDFVPAQLPRFSRS